MTFTIKLKKDIPTLSVTENNVTCTLTMGKSHDIVTKGEDTASLARRLSYVYNITCGQAYGMERLDLIKKTLIERDKREK